MRSGMFNEPQKREYIEFEVTNEQALDRYFRRIAPKEKEYSKDIVDMKLDEALDTLMSLGIRREESRGHLLSLLKGYANWAFSKGKTKNKNVIGVLTPASIGTDDAVKESMIASPEHLKEILETGLDYVDYESKSNMSELLLRLLFEGITLEEIQALKKTDIDEHNRIKTIHGKEFTVSEDLAGLWKKCTKITSYEKKNSRAAGSKKKNINEFSELVLADNEFLFRPVLSVSVNEKDMITLDSLRKIIVAVFYACERKTIPARNINYSGIFYKLLLLERQGTKLTPEIYAEYFRVAENSKNYLTNLTRKWRIDYEDWKIAFGYTKA